MQLVAHALCCMAAQGRPLFLELRAANTPATALYERFGFRRVGRKTTFAAEDAILMEKAVVSAYSEPLRNNQRHNSERR